MATILIVEDDAKIRRLLSLRLGIQGHQIETAENGKQGMEAALANSYDLVLMDMHMPVMDGHEATRVMREKGYQGIIIAVTASVMSAETDSAIQSGCNGCIAKPIDEDFEQLVQSFLDD